MDQVHIILPVHIPSDVDITKSVCVGSGAGPPADEGEAGAGEVPDAAAESRR